MNASTFFGRTMKTILIIEDNDIMRDNTTEILELSNYYVQSASNGRIGLEMARQIHPDLIICDMTMPEMDGNEVLKEIIKQSDLKQIPFIFLTAHSEKSDIINGFNLGATDYVTKPFDGTQLIRVVQKYLHE